ncbi:cell division protein ZipA [Alteromonas aestuariivivens]|uniref:Cell division protein ZipA n=1 Tax=Alteromonas aestuariivivens TaxID=1938339 RepID=A0A3D8M8D1_9ALTE|nr:cell division protein ZipA [Alteromonas aestuariivivens]RDV26097.1 cell division protein ZipA [Alteromonas aestuariivivens]
MEDELRLSLLVLGSCFIVAILAHGIWKIRKGNHSTGKSTRMEPREWQNQDDDEPLDNDDITWDEQKLSDSQQKHFQEEMQEPDYDDLGLGKVRVVSSHHSVETNQPDSDENSPAIDEPEEPETQPGTFQPENEPVTEAQPQPAQKLYGSVITNPKPHMQTTARNMADKSEQSDFPEPPGFLLKTGQSGDEAETPEKASVADPELDNFSLDSQPAGPAETARWDIAESEASQAGGLGEQARRFVSRKRKQAPHRKRQEPSFGDDQMRIDFEPDQSDDLSQQTGAVDAEAQDGQQTPLAEQEVLVLNVRAAQDEPISGAALLPLLLTLGFKFGDQNIFHRHVNSNGKGPVLFSLANMFKPGVFDIDNLETFMTQGVSLFMILPIEGDAHQVFNMMHNAARKIAEEFNAQVLDGRRSVLTKQGLQQYMEKIREFERQRFISRQ